MPEEITDAPAEGAATPAEAPVEGTTVLHDDAADAPAQEVAATPKAEDTEGDKAVEGAPETYTDFTLPEGFEMEEGALEAFIPVAKDLNLSQEQAQKLVEMRAEMVEQETEKALEAFNETVTGWLEEAKADKDIGGAKFDENVSFARKFLDGFGSPGLRSVLDQTGVGNHPEIIRAFALAGKAMSESQMFAGGQANEDTGPRSAADILFPEHAKTQ